MNWRFYADIAKRQPMLLRVADRLGRSRGRLRALDSYLCAPPPAAPVKPDLRDWERQSLAAVWIGHATILLRIGGMNVITDPVFSNRIGLGAGLFTVGPRRLFAPALSINELPKIDLILVSHAHFDHLDRPSLLKFDRRIPVITSKHNDDLIRDLGFRRVRALDIGNVVQVGALKITSREVKHWGPRVFLDKHRGYCAFLIESAQSKVLFGADTAFGEHFDDLREIDLAILGISAYNPYIAAHATPEQAWEMFTRMKARALLPMHHSTFKLSYEPTAEPMQRLIAAAGSGAARIVVRRIGESWRSLLSS